MWEIKTAVEEYRCFGDSIANTETLINKLVVQNRDVWHIKSIMICRPQF